MGHIFSQSVSVHPQIFYISNICTVRVNKNRKSNHVNNKKEENPNERKVKSYCVPAPAR
jgi:hypothetical protein